MPTMLVNELRLHPACAKVPPMSPDEWGDFLEDVKRRGVQEPIVVQRGGIVLDGRHRWEAAKLRGDQTIPARAVDLSEQEQTEFIIAAAVLRRHLTDDQRSFLAARFREPLSQAARADRARKGGRTGGLGRIKATSLSVNVADKPLPKRDTRKEAAARFRVPERKLRAAAAVQEERPDLADRVLAGELTLPQAKQELRREQKREELKAKAQACKTARSGHPIWEIVHGDCLEILSSLSKKARLIFADPPYNIGVDYGNGEAADQLDDATYVAWAERWLAACRDALTTDGSLWVLIGDEYAAEYGITLKRLGLSIRSWIKWYESFGVNCSRNFNRCSRHLFYCVRDPKHFVFHEGAVTRLSDRLAKYGDKRASPGGKLWDNVWGIAPPIPRLTGTCQERLPDFPTQLPLALVEPVVLCATDQDDLVVDPFCGSGTTGAAALKHGRQFLGMEWSERFAKLARLRLQGIEHG
jgi:DNA modification methylase/ParB-like chromosome segregation protein Spo0J